MIGEKAKSRIARGEVPPQLNFVAPAAAATLVEDNPTAGALATNTDLKDARRAQMEGMKTIGMISKIAAVEEERTITLTFLAAGPAAAAVMSEVTQGDDANACEDAAWTALSAVLDCNDGSGLKTDDIVVGGRSSMRAGRSNQLRHRRSGVYTLRVKEFYVAHVTRKMQDTAVVSVPIEEPDFEVTVGSEMFPSAVIEQIYIQTGGAAAVMRKAWETEGKFTYLIKTTSAAMATLVVKNGLVLTEENVRYEWRVVHARVTMEQVFIYGSMGLGSTKRDVLPEVAGGFGLSSDLVRVTEVGDTLPGCGFVGCIKFPYSSERYDLVYELLDMGSFLVFNSEKPHLKPLEIFISNSLVELQHVTGVAIVRPTIAAPTETAEEMQAVRVAPSLSFIQGTGGPKIVTGADADAKAREESLLRSCQKERKRAEEAEASSGSSSNTYALIPARVWAWRARAVRMAVAEARWRRERRGGLERAWSTWRDGLGTRRVEHALPMYPDNGGVVVGGQDQDNRSWPEGAVRLLQVPAAEGEGDGVSEAAGDESGAGRPGVGSSSERRGCGGEVRSASGGSPARAAQGGPDGRGYEGVPLREASGWRGRLGGVGREGRRRERSRVEGLACDGRARRRRK
jgi:hypothetical protein